MRSNRSPRIVCTIIEIKATVFKDCSLICLKVARFTYNGSNIAMRYRIFSFSPSFFFSPGTVAFHVPCERYPAKCSVPCVWRRRYFVRHLWIFIKSRVKISRRDMRIPYDSVLNNIIPNSKLQTYSFLVCEPVVQICLSLTSVKGSIEINSREPRSRAVRRNKLPVPRRFMKMKNV